MDNTHQAALAEGPIVSDGLKRLWKEFVQLATPYGATRARLERWDTLRTRARLDWTALIDADRHGQDICDDALIKLLPYDDTPTARARGAFVHVAPAIRGDLRAWFEGAGWTHREDWDGIGRGLFDFVRRCAEEPAELWQACEEFATLPGAAAFDCSMLSPILNALRPDEFLLVNANGRAVLNHHAGGSFAAKLVDYPPANARARVMLQELCTVSLPPRLAGTRPGDLFESFCHWLVNDSAGGLAAAEDEPAEDMPADEAPDEQTPAESAAPEPEPASTLEPVEAEPTPEAEPDDAPVTPEPAPVAADEAPVDAPSERIGQDETPTRPNDESGTGDELDALLSRVHQDLLRKGQLLLCGAPGSGRTALAERLAERLVSGGDGLRERLVFHAAWSYEDFIQRQLPNGGRRAGRFLSLCQAAAVRRDACVLIIHDIQRASVEAVLGEALTMLEQRGRETTLCGGGRLSIPPNLFVIGTFDTSDASAPEASLALQQRFAHVFLENDGEPPRGEDPSQGVSRRDLPGVGSVL